MTITDNSAAGEGQVKVSVRKRGAVLPYLDPAVHQPVATVVLGDQEDASNGLCGERRYAAESCTFDYPPRFSCW